MQKISRPREDGPEDETNMPDKYLAWLGFEMSRGQ
jgi:hypothetical protein